MVKIRVRKTIQNNVTRYVWRQSGMNPPAVSRSALISFYHNSRKKNKVTIQQIEKAL